MNQYLYCNFSNFICDHGEAPKMYVDSITHNGCNIPVCSKSNYEAVSPKHKQIEANLMAKHFQGPLHELLEWLQPTRVEC